LGAGRRNTIFAVEKDQGGNFMSRLNNSTKQKEFLAQSYQDAGEDFRYSLTGKKKVFWDWVIISASNERQAQSYRVQIEKRKREGRLPENTRYEVIPDTEGRRIGSGGSTLNIIRFIRQEIGQDALEKQRIAVLHSGGDAKRIPQYSACGKLFAPVPKTYEDGRTATVFDELMITIAGVPERMSSGMLILPGDTSILFNPLQLDLHSYDAVGLSMKADVQEGKEHGVFLVREQGRVARFLHKRSVQELREQGAVNQENQVDIDTGCIWLGKKAINALGNLSAQEDGKLCLNFYSDFLMPMASETTLEEYLEEPAEMGVVTEQLTDFRKALWEVLSKLELHLMRLMPAKYIHFGSSEEFFDIAVKDIEEYQFLGWKKQNGCNDLGEILCGGHNSYIKTDSDIASESYIENSILLDNVKVHRNVILCGVQLENTEVPENILMHSLRLQNGKYVCRICAISDNPKNSADGEFLGTTLRQMIKKNGLQETKVWEGNSRSIWEAKLFAEADTLAEAQENAFILYRLAQGEASEKDISTWISKDRYSLKESYQNADIEAELDWQEKIRSKVRLENFLDGIRRGGEQKEILSALGCMTKEEYMTLWEKAQQFEFPTNMRLALALSDYRRMYALENGWEDIPSAGFYEDAAYAMLSDCIERATRKHYKVPENWHFAKEKAEIKLPVRVNFCGSPSDAAPYCLEHGGTMFTGTILLKGEYPIFAVAERLEESCIILESIDLKQRVKYTSLSDVVNCGDLNDGFALYKAVFQAMGLVDAKETISMTEFCNRIGGGLSLTTSVQVPKGSGLGTSSLVIAACIKACAELFGEKADPDYIYAHTFLTEQLMTTGGGWQDQVAGYTKGLKLIKSRPGEYQQIEIEPVCMSEETAKELQERFVLVFSGQRRLARNVLREELNQCIRNDKRVMQAMERIRNICVLMKFEMERGNITAFANYMTEQFELVKTIDKGASNTCIEYIFDACEDLIDGKSICGAGGGGFLQVVLKKGVTKKQLKQRIQSVFMDCGVEVWDTTLI